jgi:hypothetical protein
MQRFHDELAAIRAGVVVFEHQQYRIRAAVANDVARIGRITPSSR